MSQLKIKAIRAKYEAEKATAIAELDFWMNTPSTGEFMLAIEENLKKLSNANQMLNIIDAAFTVSNSESNESTQ
jgi:uncharacterized protein YtpQ (UPF0354 family)